MKRTRMYAVVVAFTITVIAFLLLKKDASKVAPPEPRMPETSTGNPAITAQNTALAPPASIDPAEVHPVASGAPLDMATVALEAKMISNAQGLLAAGKPRDALKQIEDYERVPDRASLVPQAKLVKIEALTRVGGRRTDALALAMSTRDDPAMAPYQGRIDAILSDAGLIGPTPTPLKEP